MATSSRKFWRVYDKFLFRYSYCCKSFLILGARDFWRVHVRLFVGTVTVARIRGELFVGVVTATIYGSAHTGFSVSDYVDT